MIVTTMNMFIIACIIIILIISMVMIIRMVVAVITNLSISPAARHFVGCGLTGEPHDLHAAICRRF